MDSDAEIATGVYNEGRDCDVLSVDTGSKASVIGTYHMKRSDWD